MKKLFAALCLFFTCNAFALTFVEGQIRVLQLWEGHDGVLIQLDNMVNPDNCTRSDLFFLRQAHPLFKEVYSLLVALHISKETVNVGVSGCVGGFPSVYVVTSFD